RVAVRDHQALRPPGQAGSDDPHDRLAACGQPDRPLADLAAQPPAVGSWILTEPEVDRWDVPPARRPDCPAAPGDPGASVMFLVVVGLRQCGLLRRWPRHDRKDRVEPFPPDESGGPAVNDPDFNRFRSDPTHLLTCLRALRSRARSR